MHPSGMHYFPTTWPFLLVLFLFLALALALIELHILRYAYERIGSLSSEKVTHIRSAGGGSNNDTWLMIRSSVLNLPVSKLKNVSGAAGAANDVPPALAACLHFIR